ncbi:hypothetical protein Q5P01_014854 [Channa striata]|uniref:Uncharacterized protein n=1 Tax=Channa striata TaxID=64152 RepID=A0AA88MKP7_CHASR|nr:hypothetical protein Q5P01_014854 [Channa striata]
MASRKSSLTGCGCEMHVSWPQGSLLVRAGLRSSGCGDAAVYTEPEVGSDSEEER